MTGEVGREMYLIVTNYWFLYFYQYIIKIDTESYFLYFATHDPLCKVVRVRVTEWLWKTQLSSQQEQEKSNFVM